jgi:nucleoside phosphorylase
VPARTLNPVILRRFVPLALAVAALASPATAPAVSRHHDRCVSRLLVLSAYPGEIDHLITQANITKTVVIEGRSFYVGTLRGNNVVMALAGIGLVNAGHTTENAITYFACGRRPGIDGVVFSGVSGGKTFIGDVTIPKRWSIDDGATFFDVDPTMYATATAAASGVELTKHVPLGDAVCIGLDPDLIGAITLPHQPEIIPGGDGKSADPFGGRAFPCIPGGGDVFGCRPCRAPSFEPPDLARFVTGVVPFIDPNFFLDYFRSPTPSTTDWDAEDMETAAVARVATAHGIPFIAFRALSDGQGDPLNLPGFPFQFFVYRQIAANNAAAVALAFLEAWSGR